MTGIGLYISMFIKHCMITELSVTDYAELLSSEPSKKVN